MRLAARSRTIRDHPRESREWDGRKVAEVLAECLEMDRPAGPDSERIRELEAAAWRVKQVIADALHSTHDRWTEPNMVQAIADALRAKGHLPGPGDIVVSREAHKLAGEVLEGASQHTDCDDCWYSCSTLTCDESRASTICDCGADKAAAALAALSQPHPEETP